MFILLPPSEGKAEGGTGRVKIAKPGDLADTANLLDALNALDPSLRPALYGVKDREKAEAVHQLNGKAISGPALPALSRYTGVVYKHLDPASLTDPAAAGRSLLIVSALYGLIRGSDRIADYKLPMAPRWARYWRAINAARLRSIAKSDPVVSLLPQAHAAALEPSVDMFYVEFRTAGGAKSAGHFGKAIKGRFVRFLLENKVREPKDFAAFREDGYRWTGTDFVQG